MTRRRTRYDIYYDILTLCKKPKNRTSIFYGAELGGRQYGQFIDFLLERGLLKKLPNSKLLNTDKAKKFLTAFEQINTLTTLEEKIK